MFIDKKNNKIQTYVNGSLYNILSVPSIREHARATVSYKTLELVEFIKIQHI